MADDYVLRRTGRTGPLQAKKIPGGIDDDGIPAAHAASHGGEGDGPIEIAQSQLAGLVDDLADNAQAIVDDPTTREAADTALNTGVDNVQARTIAETNARAEAVNVLASGLAAVQPPTFATEAQMVAGANNAAMVTPLAALQGQRKIIHRTLFAETVELVNHAWWLPMNSTH